jgi:spore coat protein CotH
MNSTDEEFKNNISSYFDVPSLIDYHLFGLAICGSDSYGKNQIYMTYDGVRWIASMYDLDTTW